MFKYIPHPQYHISIWRRSYRLSFNSEQPHVSDSCVHVTDAFVLASKRRLKSIDLSIELSAVISIYVCQF
jgi:hypothetical protein